MPFQDVLHLAWFFDHPDLSGPMTPINLRYGGGGGVGYQIANSSTLQPKQPTAAYPHTLLAAELLTYFLVVK